MSGQKDDTDKALKKVATKDQLRRHVASVRKRIAAEEDTKITKERNVLYEQLESRKRARIRDRLADMGSIESQVGGNNLFCWECEMFFAPICSREDNKCTVVGCDTHKRCPECDRKRNKLLKYGNVPYNSDYTQEQIDAQRCIKGVAYWAVKCSDDPIKEEDIEIREEQPDWPSDSGYVDCWICEKTYCNRDFGRHYQQCRNKVSSLCGFRAPTDNNDYCGYVCVPGHCGKQVDPLKADYCYPEDALCGTLCCSDCKTVCTGRYRSGWWDGRYEDCGDVHCKEHDRQVCLCCGS